MAYPSENPLTAQHAADLTKLAEMTAKTRELLERSKRAGVPMDDLHAENEAHCDLCKGLKREFFPGNT